MTAAPLPPAEPRRSLRLSIKDGLSWSVMHGAGERFIHPFIVLQGWGVFPQAAIAALPALAGAVIQCFSANLVDAIGRRRRVVVIGATLQALMWIAACAGVFLPQGRALYLMLTVYILIQGLQNLSVPPWSSIMGDLVPLDSRGRYFGLRNMLVGAGICVSFLVGGEWIQYCRDHPEPPWLGLSGESRAFFTLFALACVARLASAWYLWRMHEPEYLRQPSDRFSLLDFLRRAPKGNFGRFVLYSAAHHFGVGIAGPFFIGYTLTVLQFTPAQFTWSWTVHLVFFYGAQQFFGMLADRIGNKPLIALGGFGISAIPFLWLASGDFAWILAIQVYDGLIWGAFTIGSANYLYDCVTPPKRARCTAYMTLLVTIGGLLGSFAGAWLGESGAWSGFFEDASGHPFMGMLVLSGILRFLPAAGLLWTFHQVRVPDQVPGERARPSPLLKRYWR